MPTWFPWSLQQSRPLMSGQMGINRTLVKSFWPFRTPSVTLWLFLQIIHVFCFHVFASIDFCGLPYLVLGLPGLGQHHLWRSTTTHLCSSSTRYRYSYHTASMSFCSTSDLHHVAVVWRCLQHDSLRRNSIAPVSSLSVVCWDSVVSYRV